MAFTAEESEKLKALQAAADKKAEDELHEKYFNKTFWDVAKDRFRGVAGGFWIGLAHGAVIGLVVGGLLAIAPPAIVGATIAAIDAGPLILGCLAAFGLGGANFGMTVGADVGVNAGAVSSALAQQETRMRNLGREANAPVLSPLQEAGVKEALKQVPTPQKEKEPLFIWKSAAIWLVMGAAFGALAAVGAFATGALPFAIEGISAWLGGSAALEGTAAAVAVGKAGGAVLTAGQAIAISAGAIGVAGFTFGASRSLYKRFIASTDHLVNGTVGAGMFKELLGKGKQLEPQVALPFKTADDLALAGNIPAAAPVVTADDVAQMQARMAARQDFKLRALEQPSAAPQIS